jgi:hypothetical protein
MDAYDASMLLKAYDAVDLGLGHGPELVIAHAALGTLKAEHYRSSDGSLASVSARVPIRGRATEVRSVRRPRHLAVAVVARVQEKALRIAARRHVPGVKRVARTFVR